MRLPVAILLASILASRAGAQAQRQLLGKLVQGDEPSPVPVANAKVVLDDSGSHDVSDSDGFFRLFLPDMLRAGNEITVTVTLPGYAILEPPGGRVRIPAQLKRDRVLIQLLPKKSPKFYSDAQLRALIEHGQQESVHKITQSEKGDAPDLDSYLRDWCEKSGLDPDQAKKEIARWATAIEKGSSSSYELGLAAFATHHFLEAHDRALVAAQEGEANLGRLKKQENEELDHIIRDYTLAGDAAFSGLYFKGASEAYGKAIAQSRREQNAVRWADLQLRFGASEANLVSRSTGIAIEQHSQSAEKAYGSALEVYTRAQFPQYWAEVQNALGVLFSDLGELGVGVQASSYLKKSVDAYQNTLGIYTRDQFPKFWARTQNNLGVVLLYLAKRTGGKLGRVYLGESEAALRNALEVRTREQLPQKWAASQTNLGNALRERSLEVPANEAPLLLNQAVDAYRSALLVRSFEGQPEDWASTQLDLGNVFRLRAELDKQDQAICDLHQAMDSYQHAQKVYTREHLPQNWAMTLANSGDVLCALGLRSSARRGPNLFRGVLNFLPRCSGDFYSRPAA